MTDMVGCIVCGITINDKRYFRKYESIFLLKKKWEKYKKGPESLFVDAEELEELYFQNCGYWQCLYRLSW